MYETQNDTYKINETAQEDQHPDNFKCSLLKKIECLALSPQFLSEIYEQVYYHGTVGLSNIIFSPDECVECLIDSSTQKLSPIWRVINEQTIRD